VAFFEQAVLQPLAARGAYVVARPGPPPMYGVELEANAAEAALARMGQARAELAPGDRRVVRSLIDAGSSPALPLQLLSEIGVSRREFLWQNTLRRLLVAFVGVAELLSRSVAGDAARARELLRRSYFGGVLAVGTGPAPIDLPSLAGLPFDRLLANLAEPLLSAIHPLHREVAPRAELVGDRL